jgi:hypothetical protein
LYCVVPIFICLAQETVVVNGAIIRVPVESLIFAAVLSLIFSTGCACLSDNPIRVIKGSLLPEWNLYLVLFLFNSATLADFFSKVDVAHALFLIFSGNASVYRDLAYDVLSEEALGYGYIPKALQLALFAIFWLYSNRNKTLVALLIAPVILLDVITLGRHTLASFLLILLFAWQAKGRYKLLLITGPGLVFAFFFSRVIIFVFFDSAYVDWFASSTTHNNGSYEMIGEFFNTFGTYLMSASVQLKVSVSDIVGAFVAQWALPPGLGALVTDGLGTTPPVNIVSNSIREVFGPHPAHHSFVDIFSIGPIYILMIIGYFSMANWAARSNRPIGNVVYFYLLAVFYLGVRGSLSMSLPRLFWLIIALILWRALFLWVIERGGLGMRKANSSANPRSRGTFEAKVASG